MKNKLQEISDEVKQNKFRFALIVISVIVVTIVAAFDNSADEEISVDTPAQIEITAEENFTPNDNGGNIKIVMGANANDLYIGDPFQTPHEVKPIKPEIVPAQIEETPPVAVITPPPAEIVVKPPPKDETPKPEVKIILRGTSTGENPTALIERTITTKDNETVTENLLLGIGDNFGENRIVAITKDLIIFDDNTKMSVNIEMP